MVKSKYFMEVLGKRMKKAAQVASKFVTYPILGNLSHNIRTRLEKRMGGDWFCEETSAITNSFFNLFVTYPFAGYFMTEDSAMTALGVSVGVMYGIFEGAVRNTTRSHNPYNSIPLDGRTDNLGSLPGKVVSLPLEQIASMCDEANALEKAASKKEK